MGEVLRGEPGVRVEAAFRLRASVLTAPPTQKGSGDIFSPEESSLPWSEGPRGRRGSQWALVLSDSQQTPCV